MSRAPAARRHYDRPRETWFDADGRPVLKADRIDPSAILDDPAPEVNART